MNWAWYATRVTSVVAAAATFLCVSEMPACSQQAKNFAGTGAGALSCAQFGQFYKESPDYVETLYFTWAQGMMSGLNYALAARIMPMSNLASWDNARQTQHIRAYCSESPLAFYTQAAIDLFDFMRREQGLPDWRH